MDVVIRVYGGDLEMARELLLGSYRGWELGELLRTFALIGLHSSLVEHCKWERKFGPVDRVEDAPG